MCAVMVAWGEGGCGRGVVYLEVKSWWGQIQWVAGGIRSDGEMPWVMVWGSLDEG